MWRRSGRNGSWYFHRWSIGASQTVTIGAAGAANSGAAGGNGGNTSVGALISANGGTGGATEAVTAGAYNIAGTPGGTGGSGGDYRWKGSPGGGTFGVGNNVGPMMSGAGGSSLFGSGGYQVAPDTAGVTATGFGSGGGGGANNKELALYQEGGTKGVVIIQDLLHKNSWQSKPISCLKTM